MLLRGSSFHILVILALLVTSNSQAINSTLTNRTSAHDLPITRLLAKVQGDLPNPIIRPVYEISDSTYINITMFLGQLADVVRKKHVFYQFESYFVHVNNLLFSIRRNFAERFI